MKAEPKTLVLALRHVDAKRAQDGLVEARRRVITGARNLPSLEGELLELLGECRGPPPVPLRCPRCGIGLNERMQPGDVVLHYSPAGDLRDGPGSGMLVHVRADGIAVRGPLGCQHDVHELWPLQDGRRVWPKEAVS